MYQKRFYRNDFSKDWFSYQANLKQTDILLKSKDRLAPEIIKNRLSEYRQQIESYIDLFPEFETLLTAFKINGGAPLIVKEMVEKSALLNIGPMASVAGAIAEYLGRSLLADASEIIVENGGDIFINKKADIVLGIYAGEGCFINSFLLKIAGKNTSLGVCSSSSLLGHSLSLGRADLVTVISRSVIFADALATKLANMILEDKDIEPAIEFSKKFSLTEGVLAVKADKVGLWGNLELIKK